KTPDQKVDLFPEALEKQSPEGLYGYQQDAATDALPLALTSPSSDRTISSTLGELPRPAVMLETHEADAELRDIEDGDDIRVFNALGEVRVQAHVTPLLRQGTVAMPMGLWRRSTGSGFTSNELV